MNFNKDFSNTNFTNEEKVQSFYLLQKEINKDKFFIGRLSGNEPLLSGCIINNINIPDWLYNNMLFVAGIKFNNINDVKKYKTLYINSILNTTLLGIWDNNMFKQSKMVLDHINDKNKKYICAHALEPYYYMNDPNYNFNELIKNKKLLIITSHKETTNMQLNKLDQLFNKPIFNNNEFYIYKPSQQNGGSHDNNSWEYHYNLMITDITKIKKEFNFDIALVSAGGFGMLISDFIYKNTNSNVIYVGGALQLFFGIMGKRWENSNEIKKNNNWVYPIDTDKPKNINTCENGCYW